MREHSAFPSTELRLLLPPPPITMLSILNGGTGFESPSLPTDPRIVVGLARMMLTPHNQMERKLLPPEMTTLAIP